MRVKTIARIRKDLESVYRSKRKATRAKIMQSLREFEEAGFRTSEDVGPALIGDWLDLCPASRKDITNYALLRGFRTICRYLIAAGAIDANPFEFRSPEAWFEPEDIGLGGDDDEVDGWPDEDEDEEAPEDRGLSAEQVRDLLRLADEEAIAGGARERRLRALTYTYAYTGIRRNEALGLKVVNVNLDLALIRLKRNRRRSLKTPKSKRLIPIPLPLLEVLRAWIPECRCQWVFPGERRLGPWMGGRPGCRPLDKIKALGRRAGIANLTILDFRHTYAQLADGWGMGELEVQRALGHAKPSTQAHYRKKADPASLRAAAAKVNFGLVHPDDRAGKAV